LDCFLIVLRLLLPLDSTIHTILSINGLQTNITRSKKTESSFFSGTVRAPAKNVVKRAFRFPVREGSVSSASPFYHKLACFLLSVQNISLKNMDQWKNDEGGVSQETEKSAKKMSGGSACLTRLEDVVNRPKKFRKRA